MLIAASLAVTAVIFFLAVTGLPVLMNWLKHSPNAVLAARLSPTIGLFVLWRTHRRIGQQHPK